MISIEKEAKTVEEAIRQGLEQLDVERDDVEIEVIKEGGLLSKAKVRLILKETPADEICSFIEGLLERMGVDCSVEVCETADGFSAEITGKDSAIVIGYRGEVLDAIQYLSTIHLNKADKSYTRLTIDVEGYRARRVETLTSLAKRLAEKAVRIGSSVELEPMSTIDRRAIHEALANDDRVTTASSGDEPNRFVVITPKGQEMTYGTSKSFKTTGTKTRSFGNKKKRF